MKPKDPKEMSVKGLVACAHNAAVDAAICLAQFHTEKDEKYPVEKNRHWIAMKAKEIRRDAAVSELARRARAGEAKTGKE